MRTLLLPLVALVGLSLAACSQDPPLPVAQNVDLSQFQGQWYEIAKLPRVTQADCYGTTAMYTLNADGSLDLVNTCAIGSLSGSPKTVTMHASAQDPTTPAKLSLEVAGFSGDYWILDVGPQYEYAVVGHPSRSYLWILSRTPTMDPTTLQGRLSTAQADGFDTTKLEYTPQPSGPATPQGNVLPSQGHGCGVAAAGESGGGALVVGIGVLAAIAFRRRREAI
jgi:apolipoprotein D and lipocalin family protein